MRLARRQILYGTRVSARSTRFALAGNALDTAALVEVPGIHASMTNTKI